MFLFFFATDHTRIFCSSLNRRISEKSRKKIKLCIACLKSLFQKIFSRTVGAWYWRSAILSTAPRICQHEDIWPIRAWFLIPDSGIMERRHQRHVFRFHRPFPLPNPPLDSLRSPIFTYFPYLTPFFLPFSPHWGAWSRAV